MANSMRGDDEDHRERLARPVRLMGWWTMTCGWRRLMALWFVRLGVLVFEARSMDATASLRNASKVGVKNMTSSVLR
jgi:hypothetical protein